MDINKGFTEEKAMSRKLKMTEKIGGGDTTESDSPENSKSKKISENQANDEIGRASCRVIPG